MAELKMVLTEDGVAILSYRIELPDFDESEERLRGAAAFYRDLAERTLAYLEGSVAEHMRAEYRASGDARKRFTFRPMLYCLSVRREGENRVLRRVTLSRGGRLLFENETADLLSGGNVLPLEVKIKQKSRKLKRNTCNKEENVI